MSREMGHNVWFEDESNEMSPEKPDVVDCAEFDIVRIWVYEFNNQLEPMLELCELENFTELETSPLFCYDQTEKPFDIN